MTEGLDLSRREFMQVGTASLLSLGGSTNLQVESNPSAEDYEYQAVADLMGPADAKPAPDSDFFDNKKFYWYRYETTDTDERFFITQDDSKWTLISMQLPKTQVGEVKTEQFRSQFNYTFARPNEPNDTRWNHTNVTGDNPEVVLTGDASLSSKQRGNYAPGSESIPGVAFRVTGTPGTGEEAIGGYYTSDNGMLAGIDEDLSFAEVRDAGTTHRVRLDGTENNGELPPNWDHFRSHTRILRFDHLFYQGGAIGVDILGYDGFEPSLYRVHTFTPGNTNEMGTPISQPNLPVAFDTTSLTPELRASAAHYEKGEGESEARFGGEHASATFDSTSWSHVISWQKKSSYVQTNVKPLYINAFAESANVKLEMQVDATLGDGGGGTPSFGVATHQEADETPLEWVVGSDAVINSNGRRTWAGHAPGGQGSSPGGSALARLVQNLDVGQTVTLAAQGYSGSGTVYVVPAQEAFY